MREAGLALIAAIIGFALVYGVVAPGSSVPSLASSVVVGVTDTAVANFGLGCVIKGNVSYNGNQHIYHVPGQQDYEDTVIDAGRGERWFCTEAEARAAGWRKAGH